MGAQSLGFLAAGGCLGRFSRLYAAASETNDYRALVCIFMLGGNDGNNLIVPIKTEKQSYSDYIRVRGTIAGLPQHSLGVIATANGKRCMASMPGWIDCATSTAAGNLQLWPTSGRWSGPLAGSNTSKALLCR